MLNDGTCGCIPRSNTCQVNINGQSTKGGVIQRKEMLHHASLHVKGNHSIFIQTTVALLWRLEKRIKVILTCNAQLLSQSLPTQQQGIILDYDKAGIVGIFAQESLKDLLINKKESIVPFGRLTACVVVGLTRFESWNQLRLCKVGTA